MAQHSRKNAPPPRSRAGNWLLPAAAAALALALRAWFILEMRGSTFSTISPLVVDSYYYHRWALEIIGGNFWGSDVFFLRPLYPYLLAGVYAVFGARILPVQLLQAVLATASSLLVFDIGRRMFSRRAGLFAAFGFALSGILIFYTGTLLYVELTVFLSLAFVWLLLVARDRLWRWLVAGVVFGLLVICRPELLLVLPFLVLWRWRAHAGAPLRAGPLLMSAVALAVIATVPVRNYIVARDPVLFTAHSGLNFYYGNNPAADGTWQPTPKLEQGVGFSHDRLKRVSRLVDGRELSWSQASSYWMKQGLSFIAREPVRWLKLTGRKLLLFPSDYEVPNNSYPEVARARSVALRLGLVGFGLALALGIVGMVFAWPRRREALPLYLFVAAYLASSLVFYVLSRLRAPVLPFLLIFAGFGLSMLIDALKQRRRRRFWLGAAAAAAVYAIALVIPVPRSAYTAQAWTQAGNIELGRRRAADAIADFRRALAAQPSGIPARYSLVLALAGSGRVDEADAEYDQLLRAATDKPADRLLLELADARLAIARRDFQTAAQLYRAAAAEDPDYAETPFLLGLVYISMDSLPQARHWLARALAIDPGHEAARSALEAIDARR